MFNQKDAKVLPIKKKKLLQGTGFAKKKRFFWEVKVYLRKYRGFANM